MVNPEPQAARLYAPQKPATLAELAIRGAGDQIERRSLRVQAAEMELGKLMATALKGLTDPETGIQVLIVGEPGVLRGADGSDAGLIIRVRAVKDGVELPTDDGIHAVVNPPTMVPDRTWRKEVVDGVEVERENFVYDPAGALRVWLIQSIVRKARELGWGG